MKQIKRLYQKIAKYFSGDNIYIYSDIYPNCPPMPKVKPAKPEYEQNDTFSFNISSDTPMPKVKPVKLAEPEYNKKYKILDSTDDDNNTRTLRLDEWDGVEELSLKQKTDELLAGDDLEGFLQRLFPRG